MFVLSTRNILQLHCNYLLIDCVLTDKMCGWGGCACLSGESLVIKCYFYIVSFQITTAFQMIKRWQDDLFSDTRVLVLQSAH